MLTPPAAARLRFYLTRQVLTHVDKIMSARSVQFFNETPGEQQKQIASLLPATFGGSRADARKRAFVKANSVQHAAGGAQKGFG